LLHDGAEAHNIGDHMQKCDPYSATEERVEQKHLITILHGLIESCEAGERDHQAVASLMNEIDLTAMYLLRHYARQRGQFASRLHLEMSSLGAGLPMRRIAFVPPAPHPSAAQTREHRHSLLDRSLHSEIQAEQRYEHALYAGLPFEIYDVVRHQYMQIREARHRIHALEHTTAS
jgi:hypothetical protein